MNNQVSKTVEVKNGNKWETSYNTTVQSRVYESLSHDLIAKKLESCTYIRNIKRIQLYTGFIKIIVNYNNNSRSIYIVKSH